MRIWKNNQEVAYMYGENKITHEQVQQAVNSMSYCGLQTVAASFLLLCRAIGLSTKETMELLAEENSAQPLKGREK